MIFLSHILYLKEWLFCLLLNILVESQIGFIYYER